MFQKFLAVSVVAASMASPAVALADPGHSHRHGGATAYGEPGDPRKPARSVRVIMRETDDGRMLFEPDRIAVRLGEQIRFVLCNTGDVAHEFVVATLEDNLRHAEAMRHNPDMAHDDPNARRLDPKKTGEIVWRFTRAGQFDFSCLIPGHREAGMFGVVIVR